MQRKREQSGTTVRIGGYWCVRYADWRIEDGVRIRKQGLTHKLAAVLEEHQRLKRPPKYVEKLQEEFMATVNASATRPEMCSTIGQFVESNWLPFIREHRSSSTVTVYQYYWTHLLSPYLANQLARDYTTAQAERMLHEIGRLHPTMKGATLHKLRSIVSGIFKRAIGQGIRSGQNPLREVTPPKGLPSGETYAYSLEEIRRMLGAIKDETTKVIVALAGYCGLSKSEIQGLCWENYDADNGEIAVCSSVVAGKRGKTKTKARAASVPLIPSVRELLDLYRLRLGDPETGKLPSTGVMFASEIGTPLDLHNVFSRQIAPVLNVCSKCKESKEDHDETDHAFSRRSDLPEWHGWHAFRRGLATNLNDLNVLDLTIQRILRHSDVTTTRKAYIKPLDHQVTAGMERMEQEIRRVETLEAKAENKTTEMVN
jgi:integrase